MTEYFKPTHVWRGKICFVYFHNNSSNSITNAYVLVEVLNLKPDKGIVEVKSLSDNSCHWIGVNKLSDKLEGQTFFWRQEDSKALKML